jgi:CO/xanthine dehydrogenase FAD-binding subunit
MPAAIAGSLDATRVVGLARAGLDGISRDGGRVVVGACVTLARLAELDGAVGAAARGVGGPALRNMATVGGNLHMTAPYGDVGVALLALGAQVDGRPVEELWGAPGGLVRSISFDDDPASVFVRWARWAANSPAVVSVAVSQGRVAIGGVAPHPVRSAAAEASLDDPARAGAAAAEAVDPPTDAIASSWYRKRMTEVFVRRALEARHAV